MPPRKSSSFRSENNRKEFEKTPESHADRAAELFARARADASRSSSSSSVLGNEDGIKAKSDSNQKQSIQKSRQVHQNDDIANVPIPLPAILKSLVNSALGSAAFSVKEAIPLAGKLVRAQLNTQERLSHLNGPVLVDAGIKSELDRHKILIAFGVRQLSNSDSVITSATAKEAGKGKRTSDQIASSLSGSSPSKANQASKRRKAMDDEALSREYGNVVAPKNEPGEGGDQVDYVFNEVLEEDSLKGRYVYVNRAPIMTVWSTLVLERLGFERREALSLAHCYVNTTSTARGVSLGIIPASEQDKALSKISSNQPHFELMGVKIPLIKLGQTQEWRGISKGEVIGPDQAFNYMRKSMYQTLPLVIGSLSLLADSFVNPSVPKMKYELTDAEAVEVPGPDLLHAKAYELYTQFRPSTAGEWGKKSMFYCTKALALRRGYSTEFERWDERNDGEQMEAQAFEDELRALVADQGGSNEQVSIGEEGQEENISRVKEEEEVSNTPNGTQVKAKFAE
ncbi:uncharacterized protein FA14DRAFT_161184 [Meira miltonrushii]|uniref:Uncharacterized protein n=1 Tax=Meira miltonrushii TaxID=1280837 RepID=A0A316V7P2_9BASI|nr:uncharacterized protein FA14DRAFT_161184 [Meira miltonrushii]PWN33224.1 hypothetical protein FA14DRAFT_161184 [Meira miltonrushii]